MLVDDLLQFNTPDAFLKAVLCLQCASGMPEVRQTDQTESKGPNQPVNDRKLKLIGPSALDSQSKFPS